MADVSSLSSMHKRAIDSALKNEWSQALELNLEIIKQEPDSIECLNRLAKAYFELGEMSQSQKCYKDVLEKDPYNTIAQKNLKKIASFKGSKTLPNGHGLILSASSFIAEPGVTKSVTLTKVAEPQRLLALSPGTAVNLAPKSRGISIMDLDDKYLGVLPDDLAFHLIRLIKGGNKYQGFVQSVKQNSLTILIRETYRSKKFKNQASFLDESKIMSYSSEHLAYLTDDEDSPAEPSDGEEVVN